MVTLLLTKGARIYSGDDIQKQACASSILVSLAGLKPKIAVRTPSAEKPRLSLTLKDCQRGPQTPCCKLILASEGAARQNNETVHNQELLFIKDKYLKSDSEEFINNVISIVYFLRCHRWVVSCLLKSLRYYVLAIKCFIICNYRKNIMKYVSLECVMSEYVFNFHLLNLLLFLTFFFLKIPLLIFFWAVN